MQLTEIKENLDQRILNLMEHKDMARELIANDLKLIKASKSFMSNFEASFTLENEETEEASSPKKVRYGCFSQLMVISEVKYFSPCKAIIIILLGF